MAKPVSDAERRRIIVFLNDGKSHGWIGREVKRHHTTIGRIAAAEGIESTSAATKKATEARSLFAEIDRKEVIAEMLQKGREILGKSAHAREYKDAVTGLGISIDKYLLVSGEATGRFEQHSHNHPNDLDRYFEELDRHRAGGAAARSEQSVHPGETDS